MVPIMKRLAIAAIALVVALGAAIGWKIHAQARAQAGPARGSGIVDGTEVDVAARIGARVDEVLVKEGQHVTAGTLLARLD